MRRCVILGQLFNPTCVVILGYLISVSLDFPLDYWGWNEQPLLADKESDP
jgi:hypothetical protein